MINIITKSYFYTRVGIVNEWDKFCNISLTSELKIPDSLCYFIYKDTPFIYIRNLHLILTPKDIRAEQSWANEVNNQEISIDSWEIKLLEEKSQGFSYTKNCFKRECSKSGIDNEVDYVPGVYKITENVSGESFEIELYEENDYWRRLYIGFPDKQIFTYPIPRDIKYKDELFKLIINSKWKKS